MWNEICGRIFSGCVEEFKKNEIQYFVLRNYRQLPDANTGKDVDIVVNPAQLDMAKSIVKNVYAKKGMEFYDEAVFDKLHCMHGIKIKPDFGIHIDLIAGYRVKGYEIFSFDELYAHTVDYHGFAVLSEPMDSVMLLIYKIFGYKKPVLKEKYRKQIYETYTENNQTFEKILGEVLPQEFSDKICEKIKNDQFNDILGMTDEISKKLKSKCRKKSFLKTLYGSGIFIFKNIEKIVIGYRRHERSFAVLAPDGAGKTTFLNEVVERLKACYVSEKEKFHIYHFRPTVFPNLGELGEKKGIMKQDKDWTSPHRGKPAGFLSSLFRISYYTLDYIIGYKKCVRKDVHYDRFSIFDRYSYDLIVDPLRTKLNLPLALRKLFVALTTKPKIIFVLSADVETIYGRKQELTREEIKRQNEIYKKLAEKNSRFYLIDAQQNTTQMADKAVKIILDFYGEKLT